MKVFWFWVLVSMAIALLLLSLSSTRPGSSLPDMVSANNAASRPITAAGRKLKDIGYDGARREDNNGGDVMNLQDYRSYDPSPSSKAKIKPAPIEHGSPLIPHIPKHAPPPGSPQYRQ